MELVVHRLPRVQVVLRITEHLDLGVAQIEANVVSGLQVLEVLKKGIGER